MVSCILFLTLVSMAGFDPPLEMPSDGIGSETIGGSVRAFSMGGVSAGIPDSGMVSIANPSASAWSGTTGFSFGARVRDTEDPSWSEASDFPDVSVMMSLPLGVQLSGVLSGRSRLNSTDSFFFDNGSGTIQWSGSTAESYLGATLKASDNLAFSLGGRCFFGSALGDAVTNREFPGPYAPVTLQYRDDIAFSSSWGLNFGAFFRTGTISAGFSITTDRSGDLAVQRDYVGPLSASTQMRYSVPGELSLGMSARVHPRVLIGVDYFGRKALTLLGSTTEEGSFTAVGFEVIPGGGFRLRGGYRTMSGLWRDGAELYSAGFGYDVSGGNASLNAGASWESWGADQSETIYSFGIRASENWLGR